MIPAVEIDGFPKARRWSQIVLPALLPVALAFLVCAPTLFNGFAFLDDQDQILRNPAVRARIPLRERLYGIFSRQVAPHIFAAGGRRYYRPTMLLAYWGMYRVWGPRAWTFHLANVLLNCLVTLLVFLVLKELLSVGIENRAGPTGHADWAASAGALIFAVHPLHVEPVAWLAALPEFLFSGFYLVAFGSYLRALRAPARRRASWMTLASGAAFLAYLSKEMALTLPMIVALHASFLRPWPWSRRAIWIRVRLLLPFILPAIAYLIMRYWGLGGEWRVESEQEVVPWLTALLTAPSVLGRYLFKFLIPYPLTLAYSFPLTESLWEPYLWLALSCLVLAVWLALRQMRLAAFAILWAALTLLPVLNVRSIGTIALTDRYAYLPLLGLSLSVAWATQRLSSGARSRSLRRGLGASLALVLCGFAALSLFRSRQWHDEVVIYRSAVEHAPAFQIHAALGHALLAQERWGEALDTFDTALKKSRSRIQMCNAHNGMAFAYRGMGNLRAAESELRQALAVHPSFYYSRYNLAALLLQLGELKEARKEIEICLQTNPYFVEAYLLGGRIAAEQSDKVSERLFIERALKLDPRNEEARMVQSLP